MDGVANGTETDVDCGGPECSPCAAGKACSGDGDCDVGDCRATTKTCACGDRDWVHWSPEGQKSYVIDANTVTDAVTGLMWERTISAPYSDFGGAAAYCALPHFALTGWRVPTRAELMSIVDFSQHNPATDPAAFVDGDGATWTSTEFAGDPTYAWWFLMGNGQSYWVEKSTLAYVRCVR